MARDSGSCKSRLEGGGEEGEKDGEGTQKKGLKRKEKGRERRGGNKIGGENKRDTEVGQRLSLSPCHMQSILGIVLAVRPV